MNKLFTWLIKSDYVKAQILAQVRNLVAMVGAGLVAKGYADSTIVEGMSGLAVLVVSFYLSHEDVKKVDDKIKIALATPAPDQSAIMTTQKTITVLTPATPDEVHDALTSPTPQHLTSEQEQEVTKILNKLQTIKPGS